MRNHASIQNWPPWFIHHNRFQILWRNSKALDICCAVFSVAKFHPHWTAALIEHFQLFFFFFFMPGSVLGLESLHWSLRNLLCHLTYNHANMLNWHPWLIPWSVSNRLEFQGITYLLHCVSLKRSLPILNWSKFRQHYENRGHPVRFSQSCGQTSLLFLWQNQPHIHSSWTCMLS